MRKALVIIGFAAIACGGQDTATTTDAGETPPVSAVSPPSEADIEVEVDEMETAGGEQIVEVTQCLELVNAGKHAEAVAICETAVRLAPGNTDVAAALTKASAAAAMQGAAATASAAAGEAADAAGDAADAAADAADEAVDAATDAAKDAADAAGAAADSAVKGAEKKAGEAAAEAVP
jgi:hypothetical protein